jgi:hypothetical protein
VQLVVAATQQSTDEFIAENSNDVIATSYTATEMTLEINYSHSEHTIEISGTSAVPEFPISVIVMAAKIARSLWKPAKLFDRFKAIGSYFFY